MIRLISAFLYLTCLLLFVLSHRKQIPLAQSMKVPITGSEYEEAEISRVA